MIDNPSGNVTLYLVRHGQTEWSVSGKHTGRTDVPLTDAGREQARLLRRPLSKVGFSAVLSSPRSRARETAMLAGFDSQLTTYEELAEVDYGDYEGLTTQQIREQVPGWTVWTHPCPHGETLVEAARRCRKIIDIAHTLGDKVLIFAHGHILRVLAATWLELPPSEGRHLMLETTTISVLGHERETRAIRIWNSPINLLTCLTSSRK